MKNWIKAALITIAFCAAMATIIALGVHYNVVGYLFLGGISFVGVIFVVGLVKEILDAWDSERRRR